MNSKKMMGLMGLVLLAGCIQPTQTTNEYQPLPPAVFPGENISVSTMDKINPLHQHGLFETHGKNNSRSVEETKQFFRENYGLENEQSIYEKLLPVPDDYWADANRLFLGNSEELKKIRKETYQQPEFIPTFETIGVRMWTEATGAPTMRIGIGSIPAVQEAVIKQGESEFETIVFISSGWGVQYYQGVGFRATVGPDADIVVNVDPPAIVVGPTFPAFRDGWIVPIRIKGKIGESVGVGTYTITLFPDNPPDVNAREWSQKYPNYINGNSGFGVSGGLATLTIRVEEG